MNPKLVPFDEELKRNPELKRSDVQLLQDWIKKQPHLPEITDSEVALFLHSNYYRTEPSKKTIEAFYSIRSHVPEFFGNRVFDEDERLKKIAKVVVNLPLSGTTKEGYKVFYASLLDTDPSKYDYNASAKLLYMVFDLWVFLKGTTSGYVVVFNAKGGQMGHAARVNPAFLKRSIQYLQEAAPIRLKALHFVNVNPVITAVLTLIRKFAKKELMDLIHLHSKVDTLEDHGIPVSIFPNELGGQAGKEEKLQKIQIEKLREYRSFFNAEEKTRRVDESKRPGKAKTASDFFGVEGSFKTLDFD